MKPGVTNTGHSGTLTAVHTTYQTANDDNGTVTLSTSGMVYENKEVFGFINVTGPNITIRNCYVHGGKSRGGTLITVASTLVQNLVVENCTLKPDYNSINSQGIHGWRYTARWNNVSNVVDGFGVYYASPNYKTEPPGTADVVIEGNWVHDIYCDIDYGHTGDHITHNDCVQLHGGGNVTIRGNNFVCNPGPTAVLTTSDLGVQTGGMSCVMVTPNVDYGYAGNVLIENNWLDYGSACLNLNATGNPDTVSSVTVLNNRFGRHGTRSTSAQVANDAMSPYRITAQAWLNCPGLPATDGLDNTNGNVFDDDGHPIMVNR
jgi:hypothetical protein